MQNQYKNKPEQINGRLIKIEGVWNVQSGYGLFPLAADKQRHPGSACEGAWVEGTCHRGVITDYHFSKEEI